MSTKPPNNDALNDADIAAAFAADGSTANTIGPSAALDDLIVQKAKALHQQQVAAPAPETRQQKYAPVVATAAVLLIGFGLTPLNNDLPDTNSYTTKAALPDESTTQASAFNRQIDTAALGSQKEALDSMDLSNTQSMDANTDPVEDSDALGELVSGDEALTESAASSVAQPAPTPELEIQADTAFASKEPVPLEVERQQNMPNTEKPVSDRVNVSNEAIGKTNGTNENLEQTDNAAAEAASSLPDQNNLTSTSTASQDLQKKSTNSSDLEQIKIKPSEKNANVSIANTKSISDIAEKRQRFALAEETRTTNNTPEQRNTDLARNQTQAQAVVTKKRVSPENFRRSPLLWIIEIKHLHNEKNDELAREELAAFRKKYPNNSNERLLPDALQTLQRD